MSIGHSCWEAKLVIVGVIFLALHTDRVVLGLRMILLALLIKSNFTKDSLTELAEHLVDAFLDILAGFVRQIGNLLCDFMAAIFLSSSKVID